MKVCLPEEVIFLMALVVGRYEGLFTRRSLDQNYTHNKTFFKTNLTFNSIYGVVYVDGYIVVIRKMKIETQTFHDMRNSLLCPFV